MEKLFAKNQTSFTLKPLKPRHLFLVIFYMYYIKMGLG